MASATDSIVKAGSAAPVSRFPTHQHYRRRTVLRLSMPLRCVMWQDASRALCWGLSFAAMVTDGFCHIHSFVIESAELVHQRPSLLCAWHLEMLANCCARSAELRRPCGRGVPRAECEIRILRYLTDSHADKTDEALLYTPGKWRHRTHAESTWSAWSIALSLKSFAIDEFNAVIIHQTR